MPCRSRPCDAVTSQDGSRTASTSAAGNGYTRQTANKKVNGLDNDVGSAVQRRLLIEAVSITNETTFADACPQADSYTL